MPTDQTNWICTKLNVRMEKWAVFQQQQQQRRCEYYFGLINVADSSNKEEINR